MTLQTGKLRVAVVAAIAVVVVAGVAGCSNDPSTQDARSPADSTTTSTADATTTTTTAANPEPRDVPSVVPGADWAIETPEAHGMDADTLAKAKAYAFEADRNTQGVVVVRDGAIVAEWYAPGRDEESWAASWSMSKSVASALVGIAIEEGKIPSIDEPMTTYYPDWADRGLEDITLRHVLEMSSGLAWDESYEPSSLGTSNIIQMVLGERDQLAYAAARPKDVAPGTSFNYSSGSSMLLSGVLEQATGMSAGEYAQQKLWGPIGVTKVDMWTDAAGHTLTYCCVDTTSRNFARFGLLYLHGGTWGDQQIVPSAWVTASAAGSEAAPDDYGLQWWLSDVPGVPGDMYSARGHDGQYIYVIPSLDLVVVRNGIYDKWDGPAVADPNLFGRYPSDGLVPGSGTVSPDMWDDAEFLQPIVKSIEAGATRK